MKSSIAKVAVIVGIMTGDAVADQTHISPKGDIKYVQASRVALRKSPHPAGEVLHYLPTNTVVVVSSAEGDWCPVSLQQIGGNGFIACRFLSEKRRVLTEIEDELVAQNGDAKRRLDLLQQRFWVSPSAQNLIAYGDALNMQQSTVGRRSIQNKRPEYEAMKEFLLAGWKPRDYEMPVEKQSSKSVKDSTRLRSLPSISPSLFSDSVPCLLLGPYIGRHNQEGQANVVFLSDAGQIERCAMRSNSVEHLRASSFAAPHSGVYSDEIYASWDVGGYTVQFADGMPFVGVMPDGNTFNGSVQAVSTEGVTLEAECDQIGEQIFLKDEVEKNIRKLGAIVLLMEPSAVGVKSVKLLHSKYRKHVIKEDDVIVDDAYMADFNPQSFSIAFDFNEDRIADLAVVGEESGQNDLSTGPNYARRFTVYINAGGVWKMYGKFFPKVCEGG